MSEPSPGRTDGTAGTAESDTRSPSGERSSGDHRAPAGADVYDFATIQSKWLPVWQRMDPFRADRLAGDDPEAEPDTRERRYIVDMFPYPSGDLHMGHAEAYAIGDVVARYWFQRGYDVLHPVGWDSFGLPAENAAIKRNAHPADWTYANIETQAESFKRYAVSFDWSPRLHTSDPEYYRWTQWLFLRFYERGLAYRKASPVNWCPKDQTVLANEQVIAGHCERCGTAVVKKNLTQWYFKITDYAQRLLDDMAALEGGWPERVLTMQRNWIGRSTGADVALRRRGPRRAGDGLHDAAGHAVRRDLLRRGRRLRAGRRDLAPGTSGEAPSRPTARRSRGPPTSSGWPPTGPRPASSCTATPSTRSTASGSRSTPPTTCWPTTARRDHGRAGAGPAGLGLRQGVRPADRENRCAAGGLGRRGVHRRRPGDQLRQRRGQSRRLGRRRGQGPDHRLAGRQGPGSGRDDLPAARLAALAAAVLGLPDPDRPLSRSTARCPSPTTSCRCVLPDLRGARTSSRRASRPLPRRPTGSTRPARSAAARPARHRHDGHVRRLVVVLPALLLAGVRGRAVRPRGRTPVDAGRPVRRRCRARDPAPALRPVLHQGAARHGLPSASPSRSAAAQPGPGHQPGQGDEQVAGQRRRPGRADRRVRRRRGPADDGLRRSARGRHRLGRPLARRVPQVPGPGLAAGR